MQVTVVSARGHWYCNFCGASTDVRGLMSLYCPVCDVDMCWACEQTGEHGDGAAASGFFS